MLEEEARGGKACSPIYESNWDVIEVGCFLEKTEFILAYVKTCYSNIIDYFVLLRIHTLFRCSRCMWLCLILYVLQLYRYTITLNSPSCSDFLCIFMS